MECQSFLTEKQEFSVTKWQIVVLKNFIHFFRNITQINIQGQNKACAIVHPQFCIPEEQTLIYSYLIAFFENHGWSWQCQLLVVVVSCQLVVLVLVLVAHSRPRVKFWSPALNFLATLVTRKVQLLDAGLKNRVLAEKEGLVQRQCQGTTYNVDRVIDVTFLEVNSLC